MAKACAPRAEFADPKGDAGTERGGLLEMGTKNGA